MDRGAPQLHVRHAVAFVDRRFVPAVFGRPLGNALVLAGKYLARAMLVPHNK